MTYIDDIESDLVAIATVMYDGAKAHRLGAFIGICDEKGFTFRGYEVKESSETVEQIYPAGGGDVTDLIEKMGKACREALKS